MAPVVAVLVITLACGRRQPSVDLEQFRHDGPILLITIDTLRADRLGTYGSSRGLTPNIDALVAPPGRAFVFRHAVAQVPLTLPSHATILTGVHPQAHGVRTNDGFRLGAATPTLAEALHKAGYATGAFVGGYPVNAATGLARGFDRYDDDFIRQGAVERRADAVVASALAWIREHASATRDATRLFTWIHLFDPHSPYEAPPEFASAHHAEPYDAEIAYTDAALGRLFAGLRASGLFDRALIVLVADHGESLGDHGERTHGTFLYDATIHVPLLLRLPSNPASPSGAGLSIVDPVETADVAPTLAAVAGVAIDARADGMDLRPLMAQAAGLPARARSTRSVRQAAYAETYYQHVLLGWSPLRALRGPDWKYIEAPSPELYDLQGDPGETRNAIAARPAIARALAAALPPTAGSMAPPTPRTRDAAARLQALGYVTGQTDLAARRGIDPKDKIAVWNEIEEGIDQSPRDPGRAEAAFGRAARLDPGNGLVLKYLADLRFRSGRLREAAQGYRRAIAAGFRHPDVYINLGAIAEREGRLDRAVQSLTDAIALAPADADAWNRLGMIHARRGDLHAARRALATAIQAAPGRPEPHYNLALVERRAGHEAEAVAKLREAVALNPRYVEAQYALATGYLAGHQPERALEVYRAALAVNPDYAEALFGAARAALDLGRADEARRHYERFIEVAPAAYRAQVAAARQALRHMAPQQQKR